MGISNNKKGDDNFNSTRGRSSRDISRQQRAGGLNEIVALEGFRDQCLQFDKGRQKFKERLKATNRELIDHANKESCKRTRRKTKGLHVAALEIARQERGAVAAIHNEM